MAEIKRTYDPEPAKEARAIEEARLAEWRKKNRKRNSTQTGTVAAWIGAFSLLFAILAFQSNTVNAYDSRGFFVIVTIACIGLALWGFSWKD